jgi:NADPH:quinone reductase-like Zn-dependent oxidoreductase
MKAIVYRNYGAPDVLSYEEFAKPIPAENEVLIKVHAASVNPYDWHFMRGTPYLLRLFAGLRAPKDIRLGSDVSGEVEAIGTSVTQFKPGDLVFGSCRGAYAEYACAAESALALKPHNLTFEQAASVPIAAFTALQGLRDKAHIQSGQKVLINGASGGVGSFAVQIAKSFGANVTGVCSTRNVEMVRSIGANHVIDYTQQDFTRADQHYDIIFDTIGNHSISACSRALHPQGVLVTAGAPSGNWMIGPIIGHAIQARVLSLTGSRTITGLHAKLNKEDLLFIGELMHAGKITAVIDRSYPLPQTSEAIRYLEQGHARGKVIITIA